MSRNFELMQQLERECDMRQTVVAESPLPVIREVGAGRSFQWATEEALTLVQRIFLLHSAKPPQVVVFAGVDHGSGCSGISGAVAESLARKSTEHVCLLEANFRSPALPSMFGTVNHFGLTNALLHDAPIRSFGKAIAGTGLWLISSGLLADDSPNLLASERLQDRISELRSEFAFVIIDAPPLTRYADAIGLGQLADGLVLVIEAASTRREAALAATTKLRSSNINILAAVLNKRTFPIPEQLYKRL
jgi:Mrp family chromosome partitioning ATPase